MRQDPRFHLRGLLALLAIAWGGAQADDVLTQHNDNARTGATLHETQLNISNVNAQHFGKLFERGVDGSIYGQPLYASAVSTAAHGVRNLVFVATMHNTVYAFDADNPAEADPIWKKPLGPSVALPDPNIGPGKHNLVGIPIDCGYCDIHDEVGIVSTPVISRKHNAIYLVSFTKSGSTYAHFLHALDLGSGRELFGGPRRIDATVSGTGDSSTNGNVPLVHNLQNQRPALLLSNEIVYLGFASFGDRTPFHGWLIGYHADNLHDNQPPPPPYVFNTSPNGSEVGIWQAGQGPAADAEGNLFMITGNGDFAPDTFKSRVQLSETSNAAPALAVFDSQHLVVGWTGTNNHLNIMTSADGQSFGAKVTLNDTGSDAPALAVGNGRLLLGWAGTDGPFHHLNVISSTDLRNFGNKVTLGETSPFAPALAFGNGRLFIAWAGTDFPNNHLNVMSSTDGRNWGNKKTLSDFSGAAPSLAFIDGTLYLMWRGGGSSQTLNIMQSTEGINFSNKVTLSDSSDHAPALIRQNGLLLAWAGRDSNHSLNLLAGAQTGGLGGKATFKDSSIGSPVAAGFRGQIFIGWTGSAGHPLIIGEMGGPPSLGNSFVKLRPDLTLADWFSPWNTGDLSDHDNDLGSGGAMLMPGTELIVGGGKEGKLYLLDRNHLGGFCPTCKKQAGDTQILQWFQATAQPGTGNTPGAANGYHHIHGSPVFWNSPDHGPMIYVGGEVDKLRAFHFNGSKLDPNPAQLSQVATPDFSMPGAMLSISANGSEAGTGILWATHPFKGDANPNVVAGLVRALDASNIGHELWNSEQMGARDELGNCSKFSPPTIANGRVYVSTFSNKLVVYGLRPSNEPTIHSKVELPESSNAAPALADFESQHLVMAWTGTDGRLNVMASVDGRAFGGKVTLAETGSDGPALAVGNGKLFLGWAGTDFPNHHLNVISSTDLHNFGDKVTIGETSPYAPALAFGNGRLFIAWAGTDFPKHHLNVMSSTDGRNFGNKVTLGETSGAAPSLAFIDGTLFVMWRGDGLDQTLNIMQSGDGKNFSNKVTSPESSFHAPAMLKQTQLWLTWTGRDIKQSLNLMTGVQPSALGGVETFADTSLAAPAMATFKSGVYIGWTGTDLPGRHLNVGQLQR